MNSKSKLNEKSKQCKDDNNSKKDMCVSIIDNTQSDMVELIVLDNTIELSNAFEVISTNKDKQCNKYEYDSLTTEIKTKYPKMSFFMRND